MEFYDDTVERVPDFTVRTVNNTISESSDSGSSVVNLCETPLHLNGPVSVLVKSSAPYRVLSGKSSVTLTSKSVNLIESPHSLRIIPILPFGSSFLGRWNKLPDELKILVLENLFVSDVDIDYHHFTLAMKTMVRMTTGYKMFSLAREIFYKKNCFSLESTYHPTFPDRYRSYAFGPRPFPKQPISMIYDRLFGRHDTLFFAHPNRCVHEFIQFVKIQVTRDPRSWEVLCRFAQGDYGLRNLKWLTVVYVDDKCVTMDTFRSGSRGPLADWDQVAQQCVPPGGIQFYCPGEIIVEANGEGKYWVNQGAKIGRDILQELKAKIGQVVNFRPQ